MIYVVEIHDSGRRGEPHDAYFRTLDGAVTEARGWVGPGYSVEGTTVQHDSSTYHATRYLSGDGDRDAVVWHTPVEIDVTAKD